MTSAASGLTVAWVGLRRARYSEVRGGTHRRLFRLCSRRRRKAAAQWLGSSVWLVMTVAPATRVAGTAASGTRSSARSKGERR
jgi:hypothetical protein